MRARTAIQSIFGKRNEARSGVILVVLRILLGLQFVYAGASKLLSGWTAEGYLSAATGPFAGFFQGMAESALISTLNEVGLLLIGLALVIGLLMRPASFFGAVLMLLYYFAHFEQNTMHGYIEYHIIYIAVFALFMSGGFGHAFGVDGIIYNGIQGKRMWKELLFG